MFWMLDRARRMLRRETGSLPLAILITIIMTGLLAVALGTAVTKAEKTRVSRDYAIAQQAADAAVNDALMQGNAGNPGAEAFTNVAANSMNASTACPTGGKRGSCNTGTLNGVTWTWRVTTASSNNTYRLRVDVRNDAETVNRTFEVDLDRTQVQSADTKQSKPRYQVADNAGFAAGFFGDTEVSLSAGTTVNSVCTETTKCAVTETPSGAQTPNPSGFGRVSGNGSISLAGASGQRQADVLTLYNATSLPYGERCVGAPCASIGTQMQPLHYDLHEESLASKCIGVPKPYVSSVNGPPVNGTCYSSMTFDGPTTVSPNTTVYVTGDVSVAPGATVNSGTGTQPKNLVIYSTGAHVTVDGGGIPASKVAWAVWAPNALCSGGQANNASTTVDITGAMLCDRLITQGTWALHYDQSVGYVTSTVLPSVWAVTRYIEV